MRRATRVLAVWAVVAVLMATAAAQGRLKAALEAQERAGWEAYKNKDAEAFRRLCAPEYTAVVADGKPARDVQATLDSMQEITIHSYTLDDIHVARLGPDAAVLIYNASVQVAIGDQPAQPARLAVTSVWARRGGQWKCLRYHESEVK